MARKCGVCGEAGHDARNCPTTEDDKAYAERQKNLTEPKVIHIGNRTGTMCGGSHEWPARCMTDEYALSLPLCPECAKVAPDFVWPPQN